VIAFLLRFWDLGINPPGLNWDEVSIGYDAYSVLKTGKDQFGTVFPLSFRSLDDQKSPVYIYATVIAIAIFGKTEFAVRVTSALCGVLTVYLLYFLTQKIITVMKDIPNEKEKNMWRNRSANIGLFTAAILAITPWHVHFSRVAFEANTALFFEVLGSYLFLSWIERLKEKIYDKKTVLCSLGAVLSFVLAMYSYANATLFIAALLVGWALYCNKILRKTGIKQMSVPVVFAVLLLIPLLLQIVQGSGLTRYRATSIFYRPDVVIRNNQEAKEDFDAGEGRLSVLMHNVRIPYIYTILDNYLSHYRFTFLFTKSDLPRHQIPGYGLLYNWQLVLIALGAIFLINQRKKLNAFIPLWWLFVAPIPASLTWQVPHSIRTEVMVPMFAVLSGIGLWSVLRWVQQQDLKSYTLPPARNKGKQTENIFKYVYPKLTFLILFSAITLSSLGMIISNFWILPYENSAYWLYGRKQAVLYVEEHKNEYDHIQVSTKLDWMYLWFLWYGKYTPQEYLNTGGTVSGGFEETGNTIGKIKFKPFTFAYTDFNPTILPQNTLLVGTPEEFPKTLVPDKQINDLSGKPIIYIVKI
jgi:4-amino-4-deoxy-L-arabinose transferase-like glycosyltransferase